MNILSTRCGYVTANTLLHEHHTHNYEKLIFLSLKYMHVAACLGRKYIFFALYAVFTPGNIMFPKFGCPTFTLYFCIWKCAFPACFARACFSCNSSDWHRCRQQETCQITIISGFMFLHIVHTSQNFSCVYVIILDYNSAYVLRGYSRF